MKKQLNPILTALILLAVIGAVLGLYTKGLLGSKKGKGGPMGGGGPVMQPPPPEGLLTVTVTTFAGWLRPGFADGRGLRAQFNGPSALAAAPDGSLYVCDSRNHRLRRVAPDGTTTTVAGSGPVDCLPGGFADGRADQARLFNPTGVCVGRDGTVYFSDTGNHRIRKLKGGLVSTLAGGPTAQNALGFEQGGFRDGAGVQARFRYPAAMVIAESGDLLVADLGNAAVRRVKPDGSVTTVARGAPLVSPTGLALLTGGALCVADSEASALVDIVGSAAKPSPPAGGQPPRRPCAVCSLPGGAVAVADAEWHALFGTQGTTGSVLLVGFLPPTPSPGYRDGTGNVARLATPCSLAFSRGTLYVADFGNNCLRAVTGPGLDPASWQAPFDRLRRGLGGPAGARGRGPGDRGARGGRPRRPGQGGPGAGRPPTIGGR